MLEEEKLVEIKEVKAKAEGKELEEEKQVKLREYEDTLGY